jgi:hypothetical protein
MGTRFGNGEENPEAEMDLQTYTRHMLGILHTELPLALEPRNELKPRLLRNSLEGKRLWWQFYNECEAKLGEGGDYADIRGFANKLPEQAMRIAGVLQLVEDVKSTMISAENLARGIELARYYGGEAARLAETRLIDSDTANAEKVRKWLLERWPEPYISVPDLQNGGCRALRGQVEACRKAITKLGQAKWLVQVEGGTTIKGRFRREAWRIIRPLSHNRTLSQGGE